MRVWGRFAYFHRRQENEVEDTWNRWVYWRTHRVLCQCLAVCLTNAVGRKGSWHNGRCSMKGSINELVSMDETWKYRWRPVSTTVGSWHHSRLDRLAVVDGWNKLGKNQNQAKIRQKIRQKSKSTKINQNQAKQAKWGRLCRKRLGGPWRIFQSWLDDLACLVPPKYQGGKPFHR